MVATTLNPHSKTPLKFASDEELFGYDDAPIVQTSTDSAEADPTDPALPLGHEVADDVPLPPASKIVPEPNPIEVDTLIDEIGAELNKGRDHEYKVGELLAKLRQMYRYSKVKNFTQVKQEIAAQWGVSVPTLQNRLRFYDAVNRQVGSMPEDLHLVRMTNERCAGGGVEIAEVEGEQAKDDAGADLAAEQADRAEQERQESVVAEQQRLIREAQERVKAKQKDQARMVGKTFKLVLPDAEAKNFKKVLKEAVSLFGDDRVSEEIYKLLRGLVDSAAPKPAGAAPAMLSLAAAA